MPTHFSALLNSMQPMPHTDKHYRGENEYNIYLNKRGLYLYVNHHKFQKTEYSQIWCLCFSYFKKTSPLLSSKTQDLSVKKQPEIIKFCPKILTKHSQKYNRNKPNRLRNWWLLLKTTCSVFQQLITCHKTKRFSKSLHRRNKRSILMLLKSWACSIFTDKKLFYICTIWYWFTRKAFCTQETRASNKAIRWNFRDLFFVYVTKWFANYTFTLVL